MKLIMAVSADGYLAEGPDDDMRWTGRLDKLVFRLLTSVGGPLGAGRRTFERLPLLEGREVVCLTSHRPPGRSFVHRLKYSPSMGPSSEPMPVTADAGTTVHRLMTLQEFCLCGPSAWLIGGPKIAMAALRQNLVSEAVMCHSPSQFLGGGVRDELSPFMHAAEFHPLPQTARMGSEAVNVVTWKKDHRP